MNNQKLLITVREVKEMLDGRVSIPTIYEWTEREGFPLVRVGRKKLIHSEGFKKWLAEQAHVGE